MSFFSEWLITRLRETGWPKTEGIFRKRHDCTEESVTRAMQDVVRVGSGALGTADGPTPCPPQRHLSMQQNGAQPRSGVPRLKAAIGQLLWTAALMVTVGCATSGPSAPPLLLLELDYWDQTSPLLEKAVLEGGTPFMDAYIDNVSGLAQGDEQAWGNFASAARMALPVYKSVFAEWIKIQPPSAGEAGSVHTAYGRAWGERVTSLVLIVTGWDNRDVATFQEGLAQMETASELGRQAESLRREFNTHLVSQCVKYRAPTCHTVPE